MLLTIVLFVIVFFYAVSLSNRIRTLEKMNKEGQSPVMPPAPQQEAMPIVPPQVAAARIASIESSAPMPAQPAVEFVPAKVVPTGPTAGEQFAKWLKEDWLLKLGAFLILLGFAWLATYAFINNWIGPAGRIALGIVAGAVIMAFGWHRMQKYLRQGGVFLVLGSGVVILTIFAARVAYDFFTPLSALGIMFLCAAFVALASVRYRLESLAYISLVVAAITPLLVNWPTIDYVQLFIYLFVIMLGTVWVVAVRGWRGLLLMALIIFGLYSIPHLLGAASSDVHTLLLMSYAFVALFFVTGVLGILKSTGKDRTTDLVVAAGNGLVLLGWIMTAAPKEWQTLTLCVWAVVFVCGAFYAFRVTKQVAPFFLYAGVAAALIAAATAVELSGAALTIAYTIEVMVVALTVYVLMKKLELVERASLLFIGPVLLSFASMGAPEWGQHIYFSKHFFVLLLLALALLAVGGFIAWRRAESPKKLTLYPVLLGAGALYVYILLGLIFSGAQLTIVYTITAAAAVAIVYGFSKKNLKSVEWASLLFIIPVFLSFASMAAPEWGKSFYFSEHFFVLLLLPAALLAVGGYLLKRGSVSATKSVLIGTGAVYVYILLWLTIHAMAYPNSEIGTMVTLVAYTLVGLASYFYGKLKLVRMATVNGGVLLGAVAVRLLVVDVWDMSMGGKIVTFFLVGALFVSTAFVGHKKKVAAPPPQAPTL